MSRSPYPLIEDSTFCGKNYSQQQGGKPDVTQIAGIQMRTLVQNIAILYFQISRSMSVNIPAGYLKNICRREPEGGESLRYRGCDRAHKDFCNLGGTNRRLDRRRDLIKLYTPLNNIVTDVVIQ